VLRTAVSAIAGALVLVGWLVPTLAANADSTTTAGAAATAHSLAGGGAGQWSGIAATPDGKGYWTDSNGGSVESFGDAGSYGDISKLTLNKPVVGMATTPDGQGYWLDAADGGIFTFGDARFWGSTGSLKLNSPVVGMAPTRAGEGYWMVASDGGIFAFGNALFEGSMGGRHLNEPVAGMAPTHDGRGYWMVASDGGIFAFGDAPFEGSLGASPPASPIVNMTPTPDNNGYWLLSAGGAVYAFGDAKYYGSVQGSAASATALAATPSGGYWVLTQNGQVYSFGDAKNYGSPATGSVPGATAPLATQPPSASSGQGNGTNPASPGPVSISALSPSKGTAGGGDTIHVSGAGFTGATAVYFGGNASSAFTVTSPTTLTAVAPVGAGTVTVKVVTPWGSSAANSADQFAYVATGQLPITASGQSLEIGGVPTKFTGFNAYELATVWGTNGGCGSMPTPAETDAFFASLRPDSMVRFWAFQGAYATNINTHQLDWQPLDNVFYEAARHHVYLIPVISDQAGTCDGGTWQDLAWYSGGFINVYNSPANSDGRGLNPLSYWDYMHALVSRYASSPALGMWEPVNEAEASGCPATYEPTNCLGHQTCPDQTAAANALTYFFTTVGAQIHAIDPAHLVEEGLLGGTQCGMNRTYYQSVGASPGIDVLSVHDYYGPAAVGGDQWSGLGVRFAQAKTLDKPIITGEVGIVAGNGQIGCESLQQRAIDMSAKMSAQFEQGDSAFLVWDWITDPLGPCSPNTGTGDNALLGLIASITTGSPSA
jgi:hypothetical protein